MAVCRVCGLENPEAARFCNGCAAPLARELAPERRKPATLLFCDVSGSTAMGEQLDAEAVRELMFSYFHEMRSAIEGHGGTVEKFVGDAVMAVFGVPEAHEDDPIRACRAALEMQQRLQALNEVLQRRYDSTLTLRIGVNSGEVVAGDPSAQETFVSGDAVNVAARLEQAAAPGEVLIGEQTCRLAGDAVATERLAPLEARGKSEPLVAYRLISVAVGPTRPLLAASRFVGRERELRELQRLFGLVVRERQPRLATIVGEPGVGKSRLVSEFSATTGERMRMLTGRCLSYGEGITYWPLMEVVRSAAGVHDEHDAGQVRARLNKLGLERAATRALATLLGLDTRAAELIPRALAELLSALASAQPLLLVVEDIHWAEPAMLDLLQRLVARIDGPLLLLATARPELLEGRPDWPVAVGLDVLAEAEIRTLLAAAEDAEADRDAIVKACGGNPLFAEELAAFLAERSGQGAVPPTLAGLLAARLDLLSEAERAAAERGSVEGELFHRGAVEALADGEDARASLAALANRDLVRPAQAQFLEEAAFRFKHALVRDAAYNGAAKRLRAQLHERFTDWLEQKAGGRITEYEEILGYHLEQAFRYRVELGPPDEQALAIARRAAERLAAAGHRASERWDLRASINLLSRAVSLLPEGDARRRELLPELGRDLTAAHNFARAEEVLTEALEVAAEGSDPRGAAQALLVSLQLRPIRGAGFRTAEAEEEVRRAIQAFQELGDERGLADAYGFLGLVHLHRSEAVGVQEALEHALVHARNAGYSKAETELRIRHALALMDGPAPLVEVGRRQQENLEWARVNNTPRLEAASLVLGGRLRAIRGEFDEARALIAHGRALFEELGVTVGLYHVAAWAGEVEELAGELAAAEREFRDGLELFEKAGGEPSGWHLLRLARLIDLQGRHEEAEGLFAVCEEQASATDEGWFAAGWRFGRARALVRRNETEQAAKLVRAAAALGPPAEEPLDRAETLTEAANVLLSIGCFDEAASLAAEALELYERKGALFPAEKTRALLAQLRNAAEPAS